MLLVKLLRTLGEIPGDIGTGVPVDEASDSIILGKPLISPMIDFLPFIEGVKTSSFFAIFSLSSYLSPKKSESVSSESD